MPKVYREGGGGRKGSAFDSYSSIASSPSSSIFSGSGDEAFLDRVTARAPTPPLSARGFAYCLSHSSDSQTIRRIGKRNNSWSVSE